MARLPPTRPQLGAQCLFLLLFALPPPSLPEMRSTWEGCGRGEGALGSGLAPWRSLPQHSQGGESQISCIPGHEMPCEVGRPQARPLLNPEGARVVWVGRTGRGCRPERERGDGLFVRGCTEQPAPRLRKRRGCEGGGEGSSGTWGVGVLPSDVTSAPEPSPGSAGLG